MMATRSLGQLTLDLVARIGGFTGPLDKAKRAAKSDMADIAKSAKAASTAVFAIAGTAAATGTAIVAFTKHAADNARELKNQAALANASTEEIQRWNYASQQVGVEQEKLGDILKDVNDRVGEFLSTGGGEMKDFFTNIAPQVGVTAEQFRYLSGPQALQLYYDSLEKANLSQQDMTFYLESVADETTALIPLLRDGGKRLGEMSEEADRLGLVLSELDLAQLEEFARQFDRISSQISTIGNMLAADLAPYLTVVGDRIEAVTENSEELGAVFPRAIRDSVEAVGWLLDAIHLLNVPLQGMQAFAATIAQAYTTAFVTIQDAATTALDFIAGGLNEIIEGFNHLPGVDVPLIGNFNDSPYMQGVREMAAEVAERAEKQRQDLRDAIDAPLPSDAIDDYLADVDAKLAAFRAEQDGKKLKPLDDWLFKPPSKSIGTGTGTSTESSEVDDLSDSYQSLLDRLYPVVASQKQFAEEMEQLDLAKKAGDVNDLADAQERLRGSYQSDSTADETYGFMQPDTSGMGAGEGDDDAWSRWLESAENAFTDFDNLNAQVAEDFTSRFGDAIEGMVFDYENLGDAVSGIADGMARSVVNALGQMAAQWLAYQAVQLVVGKTTQSTAAASMVATAQAQSVMAGLNAFTSTAAIPIIGPPAAPAAAAAAVAATQPMAAAVGSFALAGMAHDGIDSVPETGTWLLQQGERVTTSDTSAKLDRTLDNVQSRMAEPGESGGSASLPAPNISVDARGASDPAAIRRAAEQGAEMGYRRVLEDFKSNGPGRRMLKV
jgi:hypothetical protein